EASETPQDDSKRQVGVAGERRKQEAVRQQSRSDLQRGSAFFKDFGGGVQFSVFGFRFSVASSQ
ncbi:MAG: hypothetical protein ACK5UD_18970, partial [Planctomyces sp.]